MPRYSDPFAFETKANSRNKTFKWFVMLLCIIVGVLFLLPNLYDAALSTNEPSSVAAIPSTESKDIVELRQSLREQQNQIVTLQENLKNFLQSVDTKFDPVSLQLRNHDIYIERLNMDFVESNEKQNQAHREVNSQILGLQSLVLQNGEDIMQLEETIAVIQQKIYDFQQIQLITSTDTPKIKNPITQENSDTIGDILDSTHITQETGDIFVVLVDFGAFLDIYERSRSKIVPCGASTATGLDSIEKMYSTIDSLQERQVKNSNNSFTILLSTTESRFDYFDDLHGIEIVVSKDGGGYGDLCNAAANSIEDNHSVMIFVYPGSQITSIDFVEKVVEPLNDDMYADAGIVTSKVIDSITGRIISCGTDVAVSNKAAVPNLRWSGYWKNDRRSLVPSFVPAASPYGLWAIPLSLFQSVGGMMSDSTVEYTPSFHVFDLCLTIAEEAAHYDADLTDDDDIEGVCQLQERHRVIYQPGIEIEVEIDDCANSLINVASHSSEWIEFTERWSEFLEEQYINYISDQTLVWESTNTPINCADSSAVMVPIEPQIRGKVLIEDNEKCIEGIRAESMRRMANSEMPEKIDIWVSPFTPGNFSDVLSLSGSNSSPKKFVGRVTNSVSIQEEEREFTINLFHQFWVSTRAIREELVNQGIEEERIYLISPVIDTFLFDPEAVASQDLQIENFLSLPDSSDSFVFLSICAFDEFSTPERLIDAFIGEFEGREASLYIYVPSSSGKERAAKLDALSDNNILDLDIDLSIELITEDLSEWELALLFDFADCFVLPSSGDSLLDYWSLQRAQAMEVPSIAFGDNSPGIFDFMNPENSFLLSIGTSDELQSVMRSVFTNISQAKIHAKYAREDLIRYSIQCSATLFQAIKNLGL